MNFFLSGCIHSPPPTDNSKNQPNSRTQDEAKQEETKALEFTLAFETGSSSNDADVESGLALNESDTSYKKQSIVVDLKSNGVIPNHHSNGLTKREDLYYDPRRVSDGSEAKSVCIDQFSTSVQDNEVITKAVVSIG